MNLLQDRHIAHKRHLNKQSRRMIWWCGKQLWRSANKEDFGDK